MTTTDLRMSLIVIAQAFEVAGTAIIGHRLRSLPELDQEGARDLWIERLREATTVAADARLRARQTMDDSAGAEKAAAAERYAVWGPAIRALDVEGRHVAFTLGAHKHCALIGDIGGKPEARAA